ncbi:hypothetical protein [Capnocytophaga bilenii]|uniref:hypothetical protein n=1 Tax=Capnocytophaga bilenii TaxID=2819369 RepID=UPI0028D22382|nr:hypothetical protein [Capnocytophaga bilenii]
MQLVPIHRWCELVARTYSHRWCELAARTYYKRAPLVRACSSYLFIAGASLQLVPTIKELVALSKKHYEQKI